MDNIEFRKTSFKELWPKQLLPERINDFCAAGFFYDSRSDFTRCYMCNVLVCDWRDIHNPAEEHWRHQPLCSLTKAPVTKLQVGVHHYKSFNLIKKMLFLLPVFHLKY
ncbi:hypothetical protein B566_EDAN001093 [Ephemera danica]|nr:hypothetical protein B566_EDAN001093 [Ephemera danica]